MAQALREVNCRGTFRSFTNRRPYRSLISVQIPRASLVSKSSPRGKSETYLTRDLASAPQPLRSSHGRGSRVQVVKASAEPSAKSADTIKVVLPTQEAKESVKFALTRIGDQNAVVIDRLVGGTTASLEGVRPGQRLVAISDPMRSGDNTLWHLNDRPSMRFVRDALSMRQGETITLVLSRDLADAEEKPAQQSMDTTADPVMQSGFDMSLFSDDDSPTSSVDSAESSAEGDGRRKRTIAERLEAQYAKDQNLGREQQTAFERRQQTRREYMERESKRDDGKFVLIVAAVVLLPALTILGYAYFSGYLDRLSDSYTTFR